MFGHAKTEHTEISPAEAFLGFGMTAMAVDGELSDVELAEIIGIIDRLELQDDVLISREEIGLPWAQLVELAQEKINRLGLPEFYQQAKSALDESAYPLAFKFALRVALADNEVMTEENDFLIELSRDLGITSAQLQEMARTVRD